MTREKRTDEQDRPYSQDTNHELSEDELSRVAGGGQGYDENEHAYYMDCPKCGVRVFNARPGDHIKCPLCRHEFDVPGE